MLEAKVNLTTILFTGMEVVELKVVLALFSRVRLDISIFTLNCCARTIAAEEGVDVVLKSVRKQIKELAEDEPQAPTPASIESARIAQLEIEAPKN